MQCRCCRADVAPDMASCRVCGFTTLGELDSGSAILQKYRAQRLKDAAVSVRFYHYAYDEDGELKEEKSGYVRITDALSLTDGNIFWFGEPFDGGEISRDIPIEVRIDRSGTSTETTLTACPDGKLECRRLGVLLDAGFQLRLAVGDENHYCLTDSFALLPTGAKKQEV